MLSVRSGVHRLIGLFVVAMAILATPTWAQLGKPVAPSKPANTAPATDQTIGADQIAAVVNKGVVTQLQVNDRVAFLTADLKSRGAPIPPVDALKKIAIDQLIAELLVEQEAKRLRVEVNPAEVDNAILSIAQRNRMDEAQFKKQVQALGLSWNDFREKITRDILFEKMRNRLAETIMMVSDSEIDAYLQEQKARKASGLEPPKPPPPPPPPPQPKPRAQPVQPLILGLAQIFVKVPESATPAEVEALRQKILKLRAQLNKQSFEAVAKASSEGPEAAQGGDLGIRPATDWPALFVKAVANLQPGQVSAVIKSPAGFHLVKLIGRAGGEPPKQPEPPPPPPMAQDNTPKEPTGPMMVQQTKARHILIKTTAVMSDEKAKQRLEEARLRITEGGEPFATIAQRVSEDASAPSGGELGWLNPGETVPPFENAMNALAIGQVSEPVKSQFGWHLILVEERRTKDMAEQYQRNLARQALFERRAAASFEAWLQQVKNQSYIDNRLNRLSSGAQQ